MGLAEQSVEAVIEAGPEAQFGAMEGAVLALSQARVEALVLVLVVVETILLEGMKKSSLVAVQTA